MIAIRDCGTVDRAADVLRCTPEDLRSAMYRLGLSDLLREIETKRVRKLLEG
jgi:hypothetical protein